MSLKFRAEYGEPVVVRVDHEGKNPERVVYDEDAAKFARLVAEWKEATKLDSMLVTSVAHPAYLQIIGMGRRAVPLLLDEMARRPDHWHRALTAITGENPVPKAARGNIRAMAEAWLAWGRRAGWLHERSVS